MVPVSDVLNLLVGPGQSLVSTYSIGKVLLQNMRRHLGDLKHGSFGVVYSETIFRRENCMESTSAGAEYWNWGKCHF